MYQSGRCAKVNWYVLAATAIKPSVDTPEQSFSFKFSAATIKIHSETFSSGGALINYSITTEDQRRQHCIRRPATEEHSSTTALLQRTSDGNTACNDCVITGCSIPTGRLTRVKRRQVTQLNRKAKRQCKKHECKHEDVKLTNQEVTLVKNGRMLKDRHIDAANQMQFPEVRGLKSPVMGQTLSFPATGQTLSFPATDPPHLSKFYTLGGITG